jgi:hypothetical protein
LVTVGSKKRRSYKITCYSWDDKFRTIIDFFIWTRKFWNILNYVKVMPSISLEGDHRILIVVFKRIMDRKPVLYREEKIKIWKLKDQDNKEKVIELLKSRLPKDEVQSVEV